MDMPDWMGQGREWRREIAAALAVGLFVGVIGPFGTFLFGPTWLRIAYWASMFGIGQMMFGTGMRAIAHLARRRGWPEVPLLVLASAVLAGPLSALCAVVDTGLWPRAAYYMSPLDWYLQVLFVSVPLNLILIWLRRILAQRSAVAAGPAEPTRVRTGDLRDRLPARLGDRIVCLQMEDHYVRAHTAKGSDLVLIPLKQAIAELADIDGLQVHRSWWVARAAVVQPVTSGRNLALRLSNGLEVPVSRASVAKLRAAGWLAVA